MRKVLPTLAAGGFLVAAGFAGTAQAQTNVAAQSNGGIGTLSSTGFGGTADRINDSNRNGNYGNGSVAHTANATAGEFVEVAFNADYTIDVVNIFNRTDCCADRIDPFRLSLFDGAVEVFGQDFPSFIPTIVGPDISGTEIDVPDTLADRVRVTILSDDFLNLAELEAFTPVPEPAGLGLLGLAAVALFRRQRKA